MLRSYVEAVTRTCVSNSSKNFIMTFYLDCMQSIPGFEVTACKMSSSNPSRNNLHIVRSFASINGSQFPDNVGPTGSASVRPGISRDLLGVGNL